MLTDERNRIGRSSMSPVNLAIDLDTGLVKMSHLRGPHSISQGGYEVGTAFGTVNKYVTYRRIADLNTCNTFN